MWVSPGRAETLPGPGPDLARRRRRRRGPAGAEGPKRPDREDILPQVRSGRGQAVPRPRRSQSLSRLVSLSSTLVREHRNRDDTRTPGWCRTVAGGGGDDFGRENSWGFCSASCDLRESSPNFLQNVSLFILTDSECRRRVGYPN